MSLSRAAVADVVDVQFELLLQRGYVAGGNVRVPGLEVGLGELEHLEAEVGLMIAIQWEVAVVLLLQFLDDPPEAFLADVSDGSTAHGDRVTASLCISANRLGSCTRMNRRWTMVFRFAKSTPWAVVPVPAKKSTTRSPGSDKYSMSRFQSSNSFGIIENFLAVEDLRKILARFLCVAKAHATHDLLIFHEQIHAHSWNRGLIWPENNISLFDLLLHPLIVGQTQPRLGILHGFPVMGVGLRTVASYSWPARITAARYGPFFVEPSCIAQEGRKDRLSSKVA